MNSQLPPPLTIPPRLKNRVSLWTKSLLSILVVGAPLLPVAASDGIQPEPTSLIAGGERDARLVTPDLVEIRIAGRKESKDGPLKNLEAFQSPEGPRLPVASEYEVTVDGKPVGVKEIGYRQELYYAAFKGYDVRVLGSIYLRLEKPVAPGSKVSISTKSAAWAGGPLVFQTTPDDWNPLIQVRQTPYQTDLPKRARVGLYAGTMGEIVVEPRPFEVIDESGAVVHQGTLSETNEQGWAGGDYQHVLMADFTPLQKAGVYRLRIQGMGSSKPFRIGDGGLQNALRLYALGIYHQRCGGDNSLPFTRHTHDACHTAPVEIPTTEERFKNTNKHISDMSGGSYKAENHPAPRMADVSASLYPIQKTGRIDVAGGHHDAGDYSKYVTNGAAFIHTLATAVDSFSPSATNWDSLGIPESGDGIPDPLQFAKWEADYLLKMQDTDGGFFFLVYPLNRKYEGDALPENGDSQIVFPKNMIATAGVTGALAELGSSPQFAKHYPKEAKAYLESAKKGYQFLRDAIAKHGLQESHQAISHYGGLFDHMDELSYAAAAMFAATGDKSYENDLKTWWPDPNGNKTRRWGWWYLFEGYGAAARVYGLAEQSGRPGGKVADPEYLAKVRGEIIAAGNAQIDRAEKNAYGLPVPLESKRFRGIGWFWGMDSAMDIAAATILDPSLRDKAIQVLTDCSAYEFGANPVNRPLVSGSGDRWMREIVHQYAHNDPQILPPSGIPYGNVFGGPHNLEQYKVNGRNGLNFNYVPHLGDTFPFYNRVAADAFNVQAEFTVSQQARNFAAYAFLNSVVAAPFPKWSGLEGEIAGLPERAEEGTPLKATLVGKNLPPLEEAQIIWESSGSEPTFGKEFQGKAVGIFPGFVEVEAVWPDGRRVMARHNLPTSQSNAEIPATKSASTLALLNFDDLTVGAIPATLPSTTVPFTVEGKPTIRNQNVIWSKSLTGNAVYFPDLPHFLEIPIDASIAEEGLMVSMWIYPEKFSFGTDGREVISISQGGKRITALRTSKWPKPEAPDAINAKGDILIKSEAFAGLTRNKWHKLTVQIAADGKTTYKLNGVLAGEGTCVIQPDGKIVVRIGGFRGYADDLHISRASGAMSQHSVPQVGEQFFAKME
jgi:hypothetical protein